MRFWRSSDDSQKYPYRYEMTRVLTAIHSNDKIDIFAFFQMNLCISYLLDYVLYSSIRHIESKSKQIFGMLHFVFNFISLLLKSIQSLFILHFHSLTIHLSSSLTSWNTVSYSESLTKRQKLIFNHVCYSYIRLKSVRSYMIYSFWRELLLYSSL